MKGKRLKMGKTKEKTVFDLAGKFPIKEKTLRIIIALGIAGIVLIFLSSLWDGGESGEAYDGSQTSVSAEIYGDNLEKELKEIISKISGVGRCEILLTMENSVEYVYLSNGDTKTKSIEPTVRGVAVVCDGGENPVTKEKIIDVVTKALNISSSRVSVTKLYDYQEE